MRYDDPRVVKDGERYYVPSKTTNNYYRPAVCVGCGENCLVSVYAPAPKKIYCSNRCRGKSERGDKHPGFKGGRIVNSLGYVEILNPDMDRRNRNDSMRYIKEHRYVMEKHLGRKLRDDETVHHVNGDRKDNRIENLEIWTGRHGKGQRAEDLVREAKEILALYGHLV